MLKGKHIVLGITGSIAAYKACLIIRELRKRGAEVQVVITPAGKEFITPVTLYTLSGKSVVSEFFSSVDGEWHSHVSLGLWADAMLIAPCTAGTLGKMANGIADNMLITTYLSMKAPVFIAPAMDLDMYEHLTTKDNIDRLRSFGNIIVEPSSGYLASGLEGKGRMEEPLEIVEELERYFYTTIKKDLFGKEVLITAGPTFEKIDPVRYIGNYSSGKMGFALAEECFKRGAKVRLVSGPVSLKCSNGIERIDVESGEEMYLAVDRYFDEADITILSAAVADYRPKEVSKYKVKRFGDKLTLELNATRDIAATLGKKKKEGQKLIGFALETNDGIENANGKLKKKNFDFIVLNTLRDEDLVFGSDNNKITIISDTSITEYETKTKKEIARDIIDRIIEI